MNISLPAAQPVFFIDVWGLAGLAPAFLEEEVREIHRASTPDGDPEAHVYRYHRRPGVYVVEQRTQVDDNSTATTWYVAVTNTSISQIVITRPRGRWATAEVTALVGPEVDL